MVSDIKEKRFRPGVMLRDTQSSCLFSRNYETFTKAYASTFRLIEHPFILIEHVPNFPQVWLVLTTEGYFYCNISELDYFDQF